MKIAVSQTQAVSGSPLAAGSGRPVVVAAGYLAILAACAVIFQYWQQDPVPNGVYLLGMAVLALCLLPLALWQVGARAGAPMFELFCAAYAIAFAVPVFLHENAIRNYNTYTALGWGSTQRALEIAFMGIAAMIIGYYLIPRTPLARWLPRADLPIAPRRFNTFLFVAFVFSAGLQMVNQATGASLSTRLPAQFFTFLTLITGAGVALVAFRVFQPGADSPPRLKLILFGVVGASAATGAGTGMLEAVFSPLLTLLVARWSATRRVPLGWLLFGVAAILVMNSAKADFREQVWLDKDVLSVPEQLAVWAEKSSAVVDSLSTAAGLNDAVVRTVHRFDLAHIFAHVLELTPGNIPYYGGESYGYLLYGWIPRAIWPDKPMASEANIMFALDYGLLIDSQRDTTRMGVGFLTEAYANFGVEGVLGVMFLIGCLFGVAGTVFNGPQSDGGKAAYIAVLVFYLNGMGSSTTMFFFFGIQGLVVVPLLLRYFAKSWRVPAV